VGHARRYFFFGRSAQPLPNACCCVASLSPK
jgi:hypothetical protein